MLLSVYIKNLILIEELEIDFKQGFTAFTGETGAGKSIIFDCLLFCLGGKLGVKALKSSAQKGMVCAEFDISKIIPLKERLKDIDLIEDSDILTIRRELKPDGRSKLYVNDIPCTVTQINEIKDYLLEICGQHDNKGLLNSATHIKLLDQYSGIEEEKKLLAKAFYELKDSRNQLNLLLSKLDKSDVEKSYLKNVIGELEELGYETGEDDLLIERRKFLQSAARLKQSYGACVTKISSNILPELYDMQRLLNKDSDFFANPLKLLDSSTIDLEEIKSQLDDLASQFGDEDNELEEIESRLFQIRSVARKFMVNVQMLPDFLAEKKQELDDIENAANKIKEAEENLNACKQEYLNKAQQISKIRKKNASELVATINTLFKELMLERAEFNINIEAHEDENKYSAQGVDNIEFLIKTNAGGNFDKLAKVASGGELSRFLLAIKVATLGVKGVATIIFDEIDTGVSGATSHAIGKQLKALASSQKQVIVITHQPQVVAFSDNHFLVQKNVREGSTAVDINLLNLHDKAKEIARLLSGKSVTDESLSAAERLMSEAA